MHNWKLALKQKQFLFHLLFAVMMLTLVLSFFGWFLNFIELRQGHSLYDPILNFFKPKDVSYYIFFITYAASLTGIIFSLSNPYRTVHLIEMYTLLTIFRIITLYLVPLDPPDSSIPLQDSVLQNTFYRPEGNMKDLFFSGHTATLFLFFFYTRTPWLKWTFLASAIGVSIGLMIQHVHYSWDIIAAPAFAFLSYTIIVRRVKFYQTKTEFNQDI